jgi:DNA-binding transcriptional MerR regulator
VYSIGQLAKAFGISRSTLLYYDKRGLLRPTSRSAARYRLYTEEDYQRLQHIMTYRGAGISLDDIARLIASESPNQSISILESQLARLNGEISALRKQQNTIVNMLGSRQLTAASRAMNKQQWVDLLKATGLNDDDMSQWHIQFERAMPDAHQDFLESINLSADEITDIRSRSQVALNGAQLSM